MSLPLRIPTNCEIIYKEKPDNVLLVNIPKTKYTLICSKAGKDNWSMWMAVMDSTEREHINDNLTDNQVSRIINKILSTGKFEKEF